MFWCRYCDGNQFDFHRSRSKAMHSLKGNRYICLTCGTQGWCSDPDSPLEMTEEQRDTYWYEFQNNKTFQLPLE